MKCSLLITAALFLLCTVRLQAQKKYDLGEVIITAERKADTVFGTWKFSVADYEFYEDKLVLLTFTKSLSKPSVMLVDAAQKVLSAFELPYPAQKLYRDYLGYINVIGEEHVFRVQIDNNRISLAALPVDEFNAKITPCIDTIEKDIYFSNYSKDYPEFTYYAFNMADSSLHPFKTVTDQEQLKEYNMEYYFLKPKERLYARKVAAEYHVDKHRVAAVMSGLTSSIFYTPLYAPLFIIHDTVVVFDHYSNAILSYNKKYEQIDSVSIDYHHPKSWREWKHEIIVDKDNQKVYALYQKNGFYYLKQIDRKTGKVIGSFKLLNQYVEHIKVKNDYVYYVYRPFESLQEQFIYKELIRN
ncbi:MAG: hypothetical protein JWO09_726 [Bacteroidetes bacterium]|nr:hypothetical protein [Bacteroidota bacterium]